ncbi:hypothetical protein RMN57_13165 [Kitasatospora sp. CM 4170]|uniref:Uncharacterized protein n=1 Tax=Kitasatospora aburaviensis TaxID=67265 RepID=A0ABW1F2D5_9ACTN|nr:hypothetical protein [Kitasatospora sp. CM 4170]WNM45604.1 hypothetical protein RMN57_13165 [Kitasatospora sp. CM 4170]
MEELAAALAEDDAAEDAGMHGDDRRTCHTHQCWAEDCADQPMHTNPSASR